MNISSLYDWIGKKIATYRQEKGFSQLELAESVGLSRGSIANIEKGRQQAPLHVLWAISIELQIPVDQIIPIKNEHTNEDSDILSEISQMDGVKEEDKHTLSHLIQNKKM